MNRKKKAKKQKPKIGRPKGKNNKKKIHITVDENIHVIASAGNMSQFFNDAAKHYLKSEEFRKKMRG